jgi:hypothetical protein
MAKTTINNPVANGIIISIEFMVFAVKLFTKNNTRTSLF